MGSSPVPMLRTRLRRTCDHSSPRIGCAYWRLSLVTVRLTRKKGCRARPVGRSRRAIGPSHHHHFRPLRVRLGRGEPLLTLSHHPHYLTRFRRETDHHRHRCQRSAPDTLKCPRLVQSGCPPGVIEPIQFVAELFVRVRLGKIGRDAKAPTNSSAWEAKLTQNDILSATSRSATSSDADDQS